MDQHGLMMWELLISFVFLVFRKKRCYTPSGVSLSLRKKDLHRIRQRTLMRPWRYKRTSTAFKMISLLLLFCIHVWDACTIVQVPIRYGIYYEYIVLSYMERNGDMLYCLMSYQGICFRSLLKWRLPLSAVALSGATVSRAFAYSTTWSWIPDRATTTHTGK